MAFNNAVNAKTAGFQSLTSAGVWNGRTLTAGTGISITNGDGIGGDPVISALGGIIPTLTYLSTQTAASSASLSFDNTIITSTYSQYLFVLKVIALATSAADLQFELSTDNLNTFTSLNSNAVRYASSTTQPPIPRAQFATLVSIANRGTGSGQINGEMYLSYPSEATIATIAEYNVAIPSSSNGTADVGVAVDGTRQAINAIRFIASSGNITSGSIDCYGIS